MFYYFKDKHRLSEVKLEFKGQNCMFNSYEMELYSECTLPLKWKKRTFPQVEEMHPPATERNSPSLQPKEMQPSPSRINAPSSQ
jgi:hypothetical protein